MKKKPNYFGKLLILLFFLFIVFYAMTQSGYYESNLSKKTMLTERKIRKFEEDIKNGKTINIDDYYVQKKVDYSSFASNLGKKTTITLSKSLEKVFHESGKILKKLFW